ncbi:MAG: TetR/AcrR family transcriptional regulator, partial [Sphingopyxis sp.]|nr:TetR/AcrR family transcriptional regulator [Sphingopyxis sp.]
AASFRTHYETTAQRIEARLRAGAERGEVSDRVNDVHAWAIMGMNVFLGLRFGVWDDSRPLADVVSEANRLIAHGLSAHPVPNSL